MLLPNYLQHAGLQRTVDLDVQNFLQHVVAELIVREVLHNDPQALETVAARTQQFQERLVLNAVLPLEDQLNNALALLKLEALLANVR